MKYYRDLKNSLDTAREEAIEKRDVEIAKSMLADNLPVELISKHTGLSIEKIESLRDH